METQRLILLFALLFTGFLLYQAWQEDYAPKPQLNSEIPVEQTFTSDAIQASADIPQVNLTKTDIELAKVSSEDKETIAIKTDVLQLDISLHGGDIINTDLLSFHESKHSPQPYRLLKSNQSEQYLSQSGLISQTGPDTLGGQRYKLTAEHSSYVLAPEKQQLVVPLTWVSDDGVEVTKLFTFTRGSYLVDVKYVINNHSTKPWTGKFYGQLKRRDVGNPEKGILGTASYFGAAISSPEDTYEKIKFSELAKNNLDRTVTGGWLAFLQHYFVSAWIPEPNSQAHYYSNNLGEGYYRIGFTNPSIQVDPGQQKTVGAGFYVGPKDQDHLKAAAPALDLTIDYGWLWFLSSPLFWLLKFFHNFFNNWGWAIIMVTLCVKVAFFQLSAASYKSMAKMRKLQPKLASLKERYGEDRQAMSQAMMRLYKDEKINPLGGCLPILVQIPVFVALYWVLLESVELRHAPFVLWIDDLSAKDPYYVLPILMGVSMLIQQMLNPAPMDPMHAKVMKILPIVFTFFFMLFPSGLVLYWVVSNILSILQQWIITRMIIKEAPAKK